MTEAPDDITPVHMQSFGYLMANAHGMFRERMARAIEGTGLHMGHVLILATLRAQRLLHGAEDMTQTRLVALSGIEKSSMVLFLDILEKDGWVERRRHPSDRRAHIVHLTDEGLRRFEIVGMKLHELEMEALSVFSADERAQLGGQLQKLLLHMKNLP